MLILNAFIFPMYIFGSSLLLDGLATKKFCSIHTTFDTIVKNLAAQATISILSDHKIDEKILPVSIAALLNNFKTL